jgi:hypothetical protein
MFIYKKIEKHLKIYFSFEKTYRFKKHKKTTENRENKEMGCDLKFVARSVGCAAPYTHRPTVYTSSMYYPFAQ